MAERWVVYASPLILLAKVSLLDLLPKLANQLIIPHGVAQELRAKPSDAAAQRWLAGPGRDFIRSIRVVDAEVAAWDLGRGESEVLTWAKTHTGCCAILDDMAARNCAETLGVPVRGTFGVIILAKRHGLLPKAKPVFTALRQAGYYVAPSVLRHALHLAGEDE